MKLQSILVIFIAILLISCGRFPRRVYISLTKFQLDICGRKKGLSKWVFIYFGGSNHLICISRTVYCSLDPVLFIRCII